MWKSRQGIPKSPGAGVQLAGSWTLLVPKTGKSNNKPKLSSLWIFQPKLGGKLGGAPALAFLTFWTF